MSTWSGHVAAWRLKLEAFGRPQATVDTYVRHVELLAKAMPDIEPWDVTNAALEVWLTDRSWSRSTRAKVLVSLRLFYLWAMDNGICHRSPVAGASGAMRRKPGPQPAVPRAIAGLAPYVAASGEPAALRGHHGAGLAAA